MLSHSSDSDLLDSAREALAHHFGFDEFLAGQEPVISALLEGRDALAVMPTGGGKSLCYQLPSLMKEGVSLVISPLIALMKDQVDSLQRKGISATVLNSTLSAGEQSDRLREISSGQHKIVYIAPERFRSSSFLRALSRVPVALVAVDEAHCLSQWGHDFRPDYLRLTQALAALGYPQTAAFTATATREVREDILKVLQLRDPLISISGFERPNLSLRVIQCDTHREKYDRLGRLVQRYRTGIVYCSTRKKVEEVSASLSGMGVKLVAYHGGMSDQDREWAQNVFLNRSYDVVVATNAFGMGIDRSDVRFVAHFDVPGSIEAYYQEAGRAGRDGEPAVCELLFNYADTGTQEFFIEGNNPSPHLIRDLYALLRRSCGQANEGLLLSIQELSDALNVKNSMQVSSAIAQLVRNGSIERYDVPGERTRGTRLVDSTIPTEELQLDLRALEEKDRRDHSKLEAIVQFCFDRNCCRQQWILEYFGESDSSPCGSCDFCETDQNRNQRTATDDEFLIVQKALSGVARTCERRADGSWEGRFGKAKIISMLTGSRSEEMTTSRLNRLSTYGILREVGTAYLQKLFQELERAGLVVVRKTPYPLLGLTQRGVAVMKGDRKFHLTWPARSTESKASSQRDPAIGAGEELSIDAELLARLKSLRSRLATDSGLPPYSVFSNRVLESLARLRPHSEEDAMQISGIGKVKAERYLSSFLAEIGDFEKLT